MEERLRRRTPWNTVGGRVISLISRKGGVGKTTSAVNLGAALALSGHTVLIVGTDPQCGVCRSLGCEPAELPTCLSEIFESGLALTDLVQPSTLQNLFFISPRILSLRDEESYLDLMELRVDEFVREIDRARNLYDTILIDCPPSLGPTTRAALMASDSYLVPVQAEELCRGSVEHLLDFVEAFRINNYPGSQTEPGAPFAEPLTLEGLFLTMANERTRIGKHVAAKVAHDYSGLLFESGIPRNTRLSEMALKGKPTVIFDRRSSGSRAYFDLADELVKRYCLNHGSDEPEFTSTLPEDEAEPMIPAPRSQERINMMANPLGGLDRFLAELGGGSTHVSPSIPVFEEPAEPEMVSLDELLAEEEGHGSEKSDDNWDDGYRQPYGSLDNDRMN